MASNRLLPNGRYLKVNVGADDISSGDPVLVGSITGVAQSDKDASNDVVVDRHGSYDVSVKAVGDGGNSKVEEGDAIYYVDGDTPPLSKKQTSGKLFGYALEEVASGTTATIEVLQSECEGAGAHEHALATGATDVTASAAELNKLDGAGAVVASGTQAGHVVDAKVNYTTGDLDLEAEIIAAFNTTNGKINSILAALEAFGINASS